MSSDLILEIGCEEIPENFMPTTLHEMVEKGKQLFQSHRIPFEGIRAWGTHRRLALSITGLDSIQAESQSEILGPPKTIAYDAKGQPTAAALGFAKSQGVSLSTLQIKRTDRGEYLCAVLQAPRQTTAKLLKSLLPQFVSGITFPKMMRWNAEGTRFVRPIRWIAALYGNQVIQFSYAGVKSGRLSYGGRASGNMPFAIKSPASYQKQLKDHGVIVDPADRHLRITSQLELLARRVKGILPRDEELLERTVFMVEDPTALRGNFDPVFLSLPKEVLISAMREHQGYFHLRSRKGQLLPHFLCVVEGKTLGRVVQAGHERVLAARLSDARFFFQEDQKRKLVELVDELMKVTFQEGLGSLHDKVERMTALAGYLSLALDPTLKETVQRAAYLSKADLLTGMVGEFPKLQGIMGREYAKIQGEPGAVAIAIGDQYLPRFAGDELPASIPGKILALADKMDTITGCFGIGLVPTGSEDPYGLRRQAFGILQILVRGRHRLSIIEFSRAAITQFKSRLKKDPTQLNREMKEFLQQRLESYLLSEGFRYDMIGAVLARCADDPYDVTLRLKALTGFRSQPGFKLLVLAAKRLSNILRGTSPGQIHPDLLSEDAEQRLYNSLSKIHPQVEAKILEGQYDGVIALLTELHEPIHLFFEKVLVMAPEDHVRQNRLTLLHEARMLFDRLADFTQIVLEGESDGRARSPK